MSLREKIERWIDAQETLKAVKEEEMQLRREICDAIQLENPGLGTKTATLEDFRLTATFGITYKIDDDKLGEVFHQMSPEERECIRYKPSLDVTRFKKIESDLLNEVVIAQQSAPTLKVG